MHFVPNLREKPRTPPTWPPSPRPPPPPPFPGPPPPTCRRSISPPWRPRSAGGRRRDHAALPAARRTRDHREERPARPGHRADRLAEEHLTASLTAPAARLGGRRRGVRARRPRPSSGALGGDAPGVDRRPGRRHPPVRPRRTRLRDPGRPRPPRRGARLLDVRPRTGLMAVARRGRGAAAQRRAAAHRFAAPPARSSMWPSPTPTSPTAPRSGPSPACDTERHRRRARADRPAWSTCTSPAARSTPSRSAGRTAWDHAAGLLLVHRGRRRQSARSPGSRSASRATTPCRSPRRGTRRRRGVSSDCWQPPLTLDGEGRT